MDPQRIGGQEGLPAVGELAGEPGGVWRLCCWAGAAPELSCVGLLVSPQVAGRAVGPLATLPGAGVHLQHTDNIPLADNPTLSECTHAQLSPRKDFFCVQI